MTHVIFFQVKKGSEKLNKIYEIAKTHFLKKEKLLFVVDDEEAAKFLDDFLWKVPTFLPHEIVQGPLNTWIGISFDKRNWNDAKVVMTLAKEPLALEPPPKILYDFEDLSSITKKELFLARFDSYKRANLSIESQ